MEQRGRNGWQTFGSLAAVKRLDLGRNRCHRLPPTGCRLDRMVEGPRTRAALLKLRCFQLEPAGIQLCCNGARRNAWASTMQREMAAGYAVYLTRLGERGRPPFVRTLDPAPRDDCGTVAEQQAFHEQWSAERSAERLAEHSARTKPRWSWLRRR